MAPGAVNHLYMAPGAVNHLFKASGAVNLLVKIPFNLDLSVECVYEINQLEIKSLSSRKSTKIPSVCNIVPKLLCVWPKTLCP